MFTRHYRKILGLFLLLFIATSHATVVQDLYVAQIPVADQSHSTRIAGIKTAFRSVLVKVTGNAQRVDSLDLDAAASGAESYVQQYSFEQNPNKSDAAHPFLLLVNFAPNAINSFLLKENLPVWGQDRPLTLFWVLDANKGNPQLIGANSANPIADLIDTDTDARGIPAIMPLLDLTDLKNVSITDVQAPFMNTLQQASLRYGANALVVVRIEEKNNHIQSRWTLQVNDTTMNWQFKAAQLTQVINLGVNQVADTLANQFSVSDKMQQTEVMVHVSGLQSLNDFAKAKQYLQSLAPVKEASIAQIAPDNVTYKVQLVGSMQDLQQVIQLDHVLRAVTNTALEPSSDTTPSLDYQWIR